MCIRVIKAGLRFQCGPGVGIDNYMGILNWLPCGPRARIDNQLIVTPNPGMTGVQLGCGHSAFNLSVQGEEGGGTFFEIRCY